MKMRITDETLQEKSRDITIQIFDTLAAEAPEGLRVDDLSSPDMTYLMEDVTHKVTQMLVDFAQTLAH